MIEAQSNDYLEKDHLGKLMLKYTIPCVISMLVAALYNVVDQIFIANADYLGSYGNAANTVVFPMTVVAIAIAVMIGDGCCTFVSISLGAKRQEDACRGIGSSVIAVIAVGIVLMIVYLIFQEPILTAFGGRVNSETFQMSKEYFFCHSGRPILHVWSGIKSHHPVRRQSALCYDNPDAWRCTEYHIGPYRIFILHWGMAGAAIATIIGQIISAVLAAAYLR